MTLLNRYVYSQKMIDSLRSHMDNSSSTYITYPKFVFLCGKGFDKSKKREYGESNRGIIEKYFHNNSSNVYTVLSETLWEDKFLSTIDLLSFEDYLAEVSDCILLFVESFGSSCELGAFVYADKLFSDKLVIVIDPKHKNEKSFIMSGPIAKAIKDGATVVYAPLEGNGLLSSYELRKAVDDRIKSFQSKSATVNKRIPNSDPEKVILGTFIVEILELIRLLQPISRNDLIEIYKSVKGFHSFRFVKRDGQEFVRKIDYIYIVNLLRSAGIIDISDDEIISSKKLNKSQSFMLNYNGTDANKERNRLICRKYRYGYPIKGDEK